MKTVVKIFLITITVSFCINCQEKEKEKSFNGFTYGFTIGGGLSRSSTAVVIELRKSQNDTVYIFKYAGNQTQSTQKILLPGKEINSFANTINRTIETQLFNPETDAEKADDAATVFIHRANNSVTINAAVQIANDIHTDLPAIDSLITKLQAKGAQL